MARPTDTERAPRADGETTRRRVLEVAGERFATTGFAETTSKEIAAAADIDLASINYHFGSRAGLYQAVLAEAHRRLADLEDIERIVADDLPADRKLEKLIRFILGGVAGEIGWPMIVLGREILSPTSHLRILQEEEVIPKLQAVLPLLAEITGLPPNDPALLRSLPCVFAPCVVLALLKRASTPLTDQIYEAPPRYPRRAHPCPLDRRPAVGRSAVSRWSKLGLKSRDLREVRSGSL